MTQSNQQKEKARINLHKNARACPPGSSGDGGTVVSPDVPVEVTRAIATVSGPLAGYQ